VTRSMRSSSCARSVASSARSDSSGTTPSLRALRVAMNGEVARAHGYDEQPPMLTLLDLRGAIADLDAALVRSEVLDERITAAVRQTIADVRARGDSALRELTRQFDGCVIDDVRVPDERLRSALAETPGEVRAALEYAAGEITAYHEAQRAPEVDLERDGVRLREHVVPVDRAGCYVPGGRAAYPSSVLMTAIPARI